uniref:Cytokinin-O-glucosyltransferase 2 n=1 Tax=Cajanus cajan TaxID=3821 RepID=A0A151RZW1_CAJCA|nr:Cytokinin-O-glucosyltransferase 2 [Cajanus cajan]
MKQMKKAIVVLVPYPAQGHVSPMQKLAWGFVGHGFEAVIVVPQFLERQIRVEVSGEWKKDEVKWVGLADGVEAQEEEGRSPDFFGIESAMEKSMPSQLEGLLSKLGEEGHVACLVVDLLASWALQVADSCAIPSAAFWPAMFASYLFIQAIPHMLSRRLISHSGLPQHEGKFCLEPELPVISTEDLPWLVGNDAAKKARFKFWKRTLERSKSLKWLLVNSFPDESKLEHPTKVANKFSSHSQGCPRVLPIGPICMHRVTKCVSFWEEDLSCLRWLAKQKANSVVYISFGSWVSPVGEAKLKSLALALEASERPFLWVLRIVSWAPQNQILQHSSVACYITHCGWNSILEALQFQKKLLCYPVAGDQFVNCAYVVQVWKVGLRLNELEAKDVEEGLVRVIEDKEMDTRLRKLHERIMGVKGGNNTTGAFMLKMFVEDLKKGRKSSSRP